MQKGRARFLLLCLTFVFLFGFGGEVGAITVAEYFDENFRIHGFLRNQTGVRLKDHVSYDLIIDKTINAGGAGIGPKWTGERLENMKQEEGQLSTCMTILQVEAELDITRDLVLSVTGRGYYDAKWYLDSSINIDGGDAYDINSNQYFSTDSNDLYTNPQGEDKLRDVDLREYHLTYVSNDFRIKIGRQQIAWGEADGIRIADIVNPLDFTMDFGTTCYGMEWEDIRIPLRLIDLVYMVPDSQYQFEIELVANLEDFQGNTKGDAYGETFQLIPQQTDFSGISWRDLDQQYFFGWSVGETTESHWSAFTNGMNEAHDRAEDTFQGGIKLRGVFGGWDTNLFYYYQRFQDPLITSYSNFNTSNLPMPFNFYLDDLGLRFEYPRIQTVGGTLNWFCPDIGTVFRGEFGYVFDEPFTGMHQGVVTPEQIAAADHDYGPGAVGKGWDNWFWHEAIKKDTFHGMIGFDRPTWITFLNPSMTFFISGQVYYKQIFDYNDTVKGQNNKYLLDTMCGKDSASDHKLLTTLKINTKYFDDTIEPDVLVVWDINAHSGFVKPCIAYKPTYDLRFELGALYVWADGHTTGPFGFIKDSDIIYGAIEYKF